MAWIAGVAAAGAGIIGDMMSQSGQQQTNAMSTANMLQQEQWQTQMSDTAMQRRVADLEEAGLNPLLAVGTPGATVPGVSQPNLQNPNQAFGQLGNQVANAEQLDAQIQQTRADAAMKTAAANKAAAETPDAGQTSAQIQAMTKNYSASAQQAQQQTENLKAQISEIQARVQNIESQTKGQDISNAYAPQLQQLQVSMNSVQQQLAKLQIPEAQVKANLATSAGGVINQAPAITTQIGEYLGGKAADVHDWVNSTQQKLSDWWSQLQKAGSLSKMYQQ